MPLDASKVTWDAPAAAPAAAAPPAIDQSAIQWDEPKGQGVGVVQDLGAGLARGAKNVIDTGAQALASGFDKIADTHEGDQVRAMNEAGKAEFDKTYGGSTAAKIGQVGGEILASAPVGGLLGAGVKAAGARGLGEAIATGGLRAEGAGLATRAAGGAINGAATAGAVNPGDAAEGAAIGAALPAVVRGAGQVANRVGLTIRGPEMPEGIQRAAAAAQDTGYVVPPTQVQASLRNRILEGMAGKASTAQNASARNQDVTNELARRTLGLESSEQLTPELLKQIRARAGQAYQSIRSLGEVTPDEQFGKMLKGIGERYAGAAKSFPDLANDEVGALVQSLSVPKMDASAAVDAIGILRDRADSAYRAGNTGLGKASKGAADALEGLLDRSLASSGAPADTVAAFRDARKHIAQTYTIERAMNPATGTVNAQKLAQQLAKGKPLSGELRQAADFATAFPKAAQPVERMGSLPQISPLDMASTVMAGAAGAGPMSLAFPAIRVASRSAALSGPIQRGLSRAPAESMGQRFALSGASESETARRLAAAAPVALTGLDR